MLLKLIRKINCTDKKVKGKCRDLNLAIRNGHYKLAQILIEGGVEVNKTYDGLTPMMEACLLSDKDERIYKIVLLLLKHGHNLDVRDPHKRTALYYAYIGGCEKVIELLKRERKRRYSK